MGLVESFSGVRGVFGVDFDEALCARYAAALQEVLGSGTVVVGRDTRPSGERIHQTVLSCLASPVDVGVAPIPAVQHAVRTLEAVGGIMITASHNEPEFNGLKLLRGDGALLSPEDMKRVIARAKQVSVAVFDAPAERVDAISLYTKFLSEVVGSVSGSVLLDPNGGAACGLKTVFSALGAGAVAVNNTPGAFMRRVEPTAESLKAVQPLVSDDVLFAAGFDCDADRAELVLRDRLVSGNQVLALVIKEVLSQHDSSQTVVVNDCTSQLVTHVANKCGARVVECPVGEVKVVDTMLSEGAVVGGEGSSSGAIVFPSRCRDGVMSVLFVLRYLSRTGQSLSQAVDALPEFVSVRKNLRMSKEQVIPARERFIAWGKKRGGQVRVGDAVKIVFADSWAWMRASQTEAGVVRVICDAPTKKEAKALLEQACAQVI